MRAANPFGKYDANTVEEHNHNKLLLIGRPERKSERKSIRINGCGWIAGIQTDDLEVSEDTSYYDLHDSNPIGPSFAAALANAELLSDMNNISSRRTAWFSLFNFEKKIVLRAYLIQIIQLSLIMGGFFKLVVELLDLRLIIFSRLRIGGEI